MTSSLRRQEWARDIKLEINRSGRRTEAEEQMEPSSKGRMRRAPTHKDRQKEDYKGGDHEYREPGDGGVRETKAQELFF